jgi:hypothetical protein
MMKTPLLQWLCILLFLGSCTSALAQRNVRDSVLFSPHISFNYSYQVPGADLATRFGPNSNVGLNFHVKTRKNIFYGIEGSYLFSNNVSEFGLMSNLLTSADEILSNSGEISEVLIQQRGWIVTLNAGKLFPIRKSNVNSGILIKGGLGYMQHKIRLETQLHTVTQLEDEYAKGYDRLTSGMVMSEFVGYYHMGDSRLTNFYLGFEAYQGLTRGRRSWNFDTQMRDDALRTDLLFGIRAGWVIHIYKRTGRDFYY